MSMVGQRSELRVGDDRFIGRGSTRARVGHDVGTATRGDTPLGGVVGTAVVQGEDRIVDE